MFLTNQLKRIVRVIILIFIINANSNAQLSGDYFISDTSAYTSLVQAIDSIRNKGVNGNLTFTILPGIYNGRLNIDSISGVSALNNVTFRNFTHDSSQVVITDTCFADSNYVLRLGYFCNYFNFKGLTFKSRGDDYGKVVFIETTPRNNTFRNCVFKGIYSNPSSNNGHKILVHSSAAYFDSISFTKCLFEQGSSGLYLHGNNASGGEVFGIVIDSNEFKNIGYQGILLHNPVAPIIRNNTIHCFDDGIHIGGALVTATIIRNKIYAEDIGLTFQTSGFYSPSAMVANNFIFLGEYANRGINLGGGNGAIDIYHNTIVTIEDYFDNYGIYVGSNGLTPRINVKNNIVACLNGGSPIYIYGSNEIDEMDYNCYYTPGNFISYVHGKSWIFSLEDFVDSTGYDSNSYMAYPVFESDTNLHAKSAWFNNRGTPIATIMDDIDGEARNALNPDVGADEYNPLSLFKYNGHYSIGSGGYFTDFYTALDSLKLYGVSGKVNLDFLDGTYAIKARIPQISGTSDTNVLTISSQSADYENVILKQNNVSNDSNYIFWIDGSDFLTIQNLSFHATDDLTYCRNLSFTGGSRHINICENYFKGIFNTNNVSNRSLLYSEENFYDSLKIMNNQFDSCAHGIYFQFTTNSWPKPSGIVAAENDFTDFGYSGMYLQRTKSPQVLNNLLTGGYRGIQLLHTEDASYVKNNKVELISGHAIYLSTVESSDDNWGLIANNFAVVKSGGDATGIYMNNCDYQEIYHNSVNVLSADPTDGRAFSASSCNHFKLMNNIFCNNGGGYSLYTTTSILDTSDYNDLYTTGATIASIEGTTYNNLASLQSGISQESNSVSIDPGYVSSTDLHLADDTLSELGLYLSKIQYDIDGDLRNVLNPSIGADEFSAFVNTPPVAVDDSIFVSAAILIEVLENDYDVDEQPLSITWISTPLKGNAVVQGDTAIYYEPVSLTQGDTIFYAISDGVGGTDTATVFIYFPLMQEGFWITNMGFDSVSHASVAWGDYDADGDYDLLLTGWVGTGFDYITKLYRNDSTEFNESGTIIQGVSAGSDKSCAWTDFNNDGQLDFIITGAKNDAPTQYYTRLFQQDDGTFIETDYLFHNVTSSSVDWADFDMDGDYDLLINGKGVGTNYGAVYINEVNKADTFIFNNFGMNGNWNSVAFWVDFDSDNDLDILNSGSSGLFSTYKNTDGSFAAFSSALNSVDGHSADIADYDMDGDWDVAMLSTNSDTAYSCIYRCEEHDSEISWAFSLLPVIEHLESGSVAWGDYDNDGDHDLAISGTRDIETFTGIYQNNNGAFHPINTSLPHLGRSALAWADYDTDMDLDLILTGWGESGPVTVLARNDRVVSNTKPSIPTLLATDIYQTKANLVWNHSSDNETQPNGLTYNVRMGTTPGGIDIISPLSLTDGTRMVPKSGNAGLANTVYGDTLLINGLLPNTTYYWSVQSVDNCFVASAFAPEESFTTLPSQINEIFNDKKITVYPNPTEGELKIEFIQGNGDGIIEIFNETGQLIYNVNGVGLNNSMLIIDLKNQGIYYLKLSFGNTMETHKIVVF